MKLMTNFAWSCVVTDSGEYVTEQKSDPTQRRGCGKSSEAQPELHDAGGGGPPRQDKEGQLVEKCKTEPAGRIGEMYLLMTSRTTMKSSYLKLDMSVPRM